MRFSSVLLALSATALAQDNSTTVTTSTIQGLTGTANFLGQIAQSLQGKPLDLSALGNFLPQINGFLASFVPQGATFGDLTKTLLSPNLQVPVQAYAFIPPGVLTGPEYFVALKAAPQVVSLVQSDLAGFLQAIPSNLPVTGLASFIAQNSVAVGSAVSNIIQTALPQASSLLVQLESQAASFTEPSSLCTASATATSSIAAATATATATSIVIATATGTSSGSVSTPTIITGAADKVFAGKALAIGAVMVAALL